MSTAATLWVKLALDSSEYSKGVEKSAKSTEKITQTVEKAGDEVETLSKKLKKSGESAAKLDNTVQKARKSFLDMNPAIRGNLEQLKDLQKAQRGANAEVNALVAALEKEKGALKGATDATKESDKANKLNIGSLKQLAKGVLGVASAYAVGRAVVGFIKDSIIVAKNAGVEAEKLDILAESWKRLQLVSGTIILEVITSGTDNIATEIDLWTLRLATAKGLAEAGLEKVFESQGKVFGIPESPTAVFKDIDTGEIIEDAEALERLSGALNEVKETLSSPVPSGGVLDAIEGIIAAPGGRTAGDISRDKGLAILAQIEADTRATEQAAKDAQAAYNEFFRDLTEGLTGDTMALGVGLQFEALGGDEILETAEALKSAFESGAIDRETFSELLGLQFAEEEALKVAQDLQTGIEAGMKVQDFFEMLGLDLPPGEGRAMVEAWLAGTDLLDKDAIAKEVADAFALGAKDAKLAKLLLEADKPVDPEIETVDLEAADEIVENVVDNLRIIESKTWKTVVDIELKLTGDGSTPDEELAHGGDFIVPPGFPNDSFRIGVETGERVQVTPAGETATGAGGRNVNIGTQNLHGIDVDEFSRMAEDARFME